MIWPVDGFCHWQIMFAVGTIRVAVPLVTEFGTPVDAFPVELLRISRTLLDDAKAA